MEIELYYIWQQYDWEENGKIIVNTYNTSGYCKEDILLRVIKISVPNIPEPPRLEVVKHKTAKLNEEKQKLMAETQVKLDAIDDKVRQLQAIEFKE